MVSKPCTASASASACSAESLRYASRLGAKNGHRKNAPLVPRLPARSPLLVVPLPCQYAMCEQDLLVHQQRFCGASRGAAQAAAVVFGPLPRNS